MKKHLVAVSVLVLCLASFVMAADKTKCVPYGNSQVISVLATTESKVSYNPNYEAGWLNVSKGAAIRYYPYGTSGTTPYGAIIDVYDSYWIDSVEEIKSARFHTDSSSGSGSSVFFTPYILRP